MSQDIPGPGKDYFTTNSGCPVPDTNSSLRIGKNLQGTLLLQDINLLETIAHITHERIPERVVHAKGAGAYGYFECTRSLSDISDAKIFSTVGKKTDLFARFSTVAGGRGSADTVRDTRGFAFKMYTEEGNLDWLFFSEPVFPIRDGGKFPSFVHAQKGDTQSNIRNPSWFWDFMSGNPETMHAILMIFSDRGTTKSYRTSDIFGLNTYKFTKNDGTFVYNKIHLKPAKVENFTREQAEVQAGKDPDFHTRDLFDAIKDGNYPYWEVSCQIMTPQQAEHYRYNIFDPTKVWSQKEYPLIPFGRITLNRNPINYFSEVEQSQFSPTAIVPGWDISPDPILQTRLFAYGSTQRYRLGVNFPNLPVNRPLYHYNPTIRDGQHVTTKDNYGQSPNYVPSLFTPVQIVSAAQYSPPDHDEWVGQVTAFKSEISDIDFEQPRALWKMFGENGSDQQDHLVHNIAADLSKADAAVRKRTYDVLRRIDKDLGDRVEKLSENPNEMKETVKQAFTLASNVVLAENTTKLS